MLRCDLMDAQRQHGPYERAITVRMAEVDYRNFTFVHRQSD